jgi:large exoprotein involved in heme utilization and adhesion
MGTNPGPITVQGQGNQLFDITGFGTPSTINTPPGLQIRANNTLALIGGTVNFSGGVVTTDGGGHLEVGGVSNGQVRLNTTPTGWVGDYSNVSQFNDIHLAQQSILDASGSNGSIQLQGQNISLTEGSAALIQHFGTQASGGITVNARGSLRLTGNIANGQLGSFIQINNLGTGLVGDIAISAADLSLQDGARVMTRTRTQADGGNLVANVGGTTEISGFNRNNPALYTGLVTFSLNSGNAGNITLSAENLRILDSGAVISTAIGSGNTGTIHVNAADQVEIAGYNPLAFSESSLSTFSQGSGNANSTVINTSRLVIQGGASVGSSTSATGSAGSVEVNASESIDIQGRATQGNGAGTNSRIFSNAEILSSDIQAAFGLPPIPTGNSGSLTINTPSLRLMDGGSVSVQNDGPGTAGNVQVNANSIFLDNQGSITAAAQSGEGGNISLQGNTLTFQHGSLASATARGTGNGGRIAITADTLNLLSNSKISTQAEGAGNAGTLNLRVGDLSLNQGQVLVESLGTGNAGRLTIHANSAQLNHHSLINASTQVGQGGDVQLQVRDTLQLNGQSQILADAHQAGQGGNVSITAANTLLNHRSRISTSAQGSAVGGALNIQSDRLSLSNGSQITASTTGTGRAGSLTIRANDGVYLNGNNTRLAATSTTDAAAGSILIQTPDLQLDDRAAISVSGQGQGGAGNLTVRANTIQLNRKSTLSADVAGGDQGNITLQSNLLLLRRGSRISTNATGTASGGNIGIDSDFIAAVEGENSDITANATNSFGGRISINATGIFGTEFRPQLTPLSDITASSGLGAAYSGTVSISNPDVDPGSDVVSLPEDVVDASNQIATGCGTYSSSRFVATGRGGIPNNPSEQVTSDRPWSDVRNISGSLNTAENSGTTATVPEPTTTAQITEINSWVRNASGHVELVAVAAHEPTFASATCSANSEH